MTKQLNNKIGKAPRRWIDIIPVVISLLIFLVSLITIRNGLVNYDDPLYIRNAEVARGLTASSIAFALVSVDVSYWHPVTWLSHALDFELFGPELVGHHLTSVIANALAGGLLCLACLQMGAGIFQSAAVSLLWALHPLRVESFAWLAERKDVLCALFVVTTVTAYLRYLEGLSRSRYALWVGSGFLALLSKPTAVSLPLILLLLDFWPGRRQIGFIKAIAEKLPLIVMAFVVAVLATIGQSHTGALSLITGVSLGVRIENAVISYARYLGKIVWPLDLACFYPFDRHPKIAITIVCATLLGAITIFVILKRNRWPWLLCGWLWFVIAVAPNSGLIQAGRQGMADRFTNIGSIGLTIAVVWSAAAWANEKPGLRVALGWVAGVLLVVLAALTIRQIGYWRDTVTLFRHAVAVDDCDYSRGNLATALFALGHYDEAEINFRRAIEFAPTEFDHHVNLAGVLVRTNRLEEAGDEARVALKISPSNPLGLETSGLIALRRGEYANALLQFDQAANRGFDRTVLAAALNDTGASIASRGRPAEAEPLIQKAVEFNPGLLQARRNLVLVLFDQGKTEEARAELRRAIQVLGLRPEFRDLARGLGFEKL